MTAVEYWSYSISTNVLLAELIDKEDGVVAIFIIKRG